MLELYEVLNGPMLEQNPEKKRGKKQFLVVIKYITPLLSFIFISSQECSHLSFKIMLHKRLLKNYQ